MEEDRIVVSRPDIVKKRPLSNLGDGTIQIASFTVSFLLILIPRRQEQTL
jgi:hypothetical protein